MTASELCFSYNFNFLGMMLSKVGSGPFMLAQCVPFGIIGGALSLLMIHYKDWKYLWRFSFIIISEAVSLTIFFFLTNSNPWDKILEERKPYTVIFNSQNSIFSSMNFCFLITIFSIYNLHTT